jgi:small subunit ribosomal protein S1
VEGTINTMTNMAKEEHIENFAELLEQSFAKGNLSQGNVIRGRVVRLENEFAIVDVGLKSEGRVTRREFTMDGSAEPRIGDEVDVYVERMEDKNGEIVLSRERALREALWIELEKSHQKNEQVVGQITQRVKGGFTVSVKGIVAFLPGSQLDIRPIRDIDHLMYIDQPFIIVKMDRPRGNIVVSRRAILEQTANHGQRAELLESLEEGHKVTGIVKNITDYGAFIDLGGIDGLLHVTDLSWRRVDHPSDILTIGSKIEAVVTRYNKETGRVSLGLKQLQNDPWHGVAENFKVGEKVKGKVTNIADFGAFVEIAAGLEGLIYYTELTWTKKNVHPSKILNVGDEVETLVLDIDTEKRRISLGLKQCSDNPWEIFAKNHPIGTEIEGTVRSITEFGLFVGVGDTIDGMVHKDDISWGKTGDEAIAEFKKGDSVKAVIREVDVERGRVSLSMKHLEKDPFESTAREVKKGAVVSCTVTTLQDGGIDVVTSTGAQGFIRKADLSRDRAEQRVDRFAEGEKVDAIVLNVDKNSRKVILSIKARELEEEKKAIAEYGGTGSGASLGDILGAAMRDADIDVKGKK